MARICPAIWHSSSTRYPAAPARAFSSALIDRNGTGNTSQTIALTYTVVPEPGVALLGGLGVLALLRRMR
ncbi:MAG: hypothetical protein NTV46_06045 [Verrucomicrobia bacterium]|nr:hypothetical protein [Verrucomicrobiota bacterium]